MKSKLALPAYWGILHSVSDWVAGYLLASYALTNSSQHSITALGLYLLLAFAGQIPLKFVLNRFGNLKVFSIISVFLLTMAAQLAFLHGFAAILVAGIASAGIHLAGSTTNLLCKSDRKSIPGMFAFPGVAGFAIGGLSGAMPQMYLYGVITVLVIAATLVFKEQFPVYRQNSHSRISALEVAITSMSLGVLVAVSKVPVFGLPDINTELANATVYYLLVTIAVSGMLFATVLLLNRINWMRLGSK
ncbi:MAG: hypothetical protein H7Y27_02435 [Gemmatimonadaceae bacterium]|nr:hypothetical protein [Chitinophagaceae bacterium]